MILLFGLSLVSAMFVAAGAIEEIPLGCQNSLWSDKEICARPIDDVVAVTPGSSYAAKLRCYDCPHNEQVTNERVGKTQPVFGDNDLLFNVTVSNDKGSVLLNGITVFPKLPTIPTPPTLSIPQVRPEFSYRNLSFANGCTKPSCRSEIGERYTSTECLAWCRMLLSFATPDYLYITETTDYTGSDARAEAQYWEFGLDPIGTSSWDSEDPRRTFDNPAQKMLKVVVQGTELDTGSPRGTQDSLFGPIGQEKTYSYRIVDVKLADRKFTFPKRKPLSFAGTMSRFFGNDVWEAKGRLVYLRYEWDMYGKEGTLRNMFGNFIHWHLWELVGIIVGSVVGGLTILYGLYRFFFWVQQQRELMKWDGMDDVWDKLRREREEEEAALMDGRYRDEPGEGGSPRPPRYTDELDRMKPLPTKPLPEKPLPEVPLIDA